MKIIYISFAMLVTVALFAFFVPSSISANYPLILPSLIFLTVCANFFGIWQMRIAKKRERELNRLILEEEKRTLGRFLIHEWRGLIHSIGIQAELMERAENVEGTRVNCGVIRKILTDETDKSNSIENCLKKDAENFKKASRAIRRAVSDAELMHGKSRVKLTYNTPKKDMKADFDKLHSCVFFALMNALYSLKTKNSTISLSVSDRVLGFSEFLEISITGGELFFDKDNEDIFHPFNEPSHKFRDYFGLASVRRLATDMGGFAEAEINAESTSIYVVIPVVK